MYTQNQSWVIKVLILGNNLDRVYLKGDIGIKVKNNQPFYSYHCENMVRISYKMRRKKSHTRSLAEAKLEQFC